MALKVWNQAVVSQHTCEIVIIKLTVAEYPIHVDCHTTQKRRIFSSPQVHFLSLKLQAQKYVITAFQVLKMVSGSLSSSSWSALFSRTNIPISSFHLLLISMNVSGLHDSCSFPLSSAPETRHESQLKTHQGQTEWCNYFHDFLYNSLINASQNELTPCVWPITTIENLPFITSSCLASCILFHSLP